MAARHCWGAPARGQQGGDARAAEGGRRWANTRPALRLAVWLACMGALLPGVGAPAPAAVHGRWQRVAQFHPGLRQARGLAAGPDGLLYVGGDRSVQVCQLSGRRVRCLALEGAPVALAVADGGTVYVAMQDHVEVLSPAGKRVARWARPSARAWLTSVAVGPGRVWVADAGGRVVLGYNTSGVIVARRGRPDPLRRIPGLVVPSPHLDVAARGSVLWASNPGRHRLEAYGPDGALVRWWGKPSQGLDGFCGCCNPTDFALLPDGRFVTAEKGLVRVKVATSAGQVESLVAGPEAFSRSRAGLDVAVVQGRVVVLDRGTGMVHVFAEGEERAHG